MGGEEDDDDCPQLASRGLAEVPHWEQTRTDRHFTESNSLFYVTNWFYSGFVVF